MRAARLLAKALKSGRMPRSLRRSVPIVWPPTGTGTADTPMRDLEALARRIETENPDIWAVNVVAGFSFADMADAGVCFSAVTVAEDAAAIGALDRLAELAMALREKGIPAEYTPDEALDQAARIDGEGPAILVEPSENIGAGAPGNGTGLLRVFVRRRTANAGVVIHDPQAVHALRELPLGGTATLAIGGRDNPFDEGPLTLDVTLVGRSNGDYEVEDIHSHFVAINGRHIRMGPCAVVRHEGITILLTSLRSAPNDLGQWRSQGMNPEEFDIIAVKAAVAHRQAYNPIARASFTVATPGSCSSSSRTLPYRKLRRPIFPLDSGI
jgi:microcystin degradation protein MlrC